MRLINSIGSLLFLALLASACSSAGAGVRATGTTEPAPFDAVLIELFGTADTESYLTSIERTAAEMVVICTQSAGFEFQIPPSTPALDPPDPTSLEAAQEDGFGIISGFRYQLSQIDLDAQQSTDPNVTYVSSLTSAEFDRFYFTLDGVEAEPVRSTREDVTARRPTRPTPIGNVSLRQFRTSQQWPKNAIPIPVGSPHAPSGTPACSIGDLTMQSQTLFAPM